MWSELAPVSVPSVDRLVAHIGWNTIAQDLVVISTGVGFRGRHGGGVGSGMKHTVGCLKQHRQAFGFGCFFLALIPETPGCGLYGRGVWVGLVCVV